MIFNFFRKKSPQSLPEVLIFKDAQNAFEYSCEYSFADVIAGQPRVAIVEEALGGHDEKGFQSALLRVAGNHDHFNVIASTAVPFVPPLQVGDLTLWVPVEMSAMALGITDTRKAWLGFIVGVLAPELSIKTHNYRMKIDYKDYKPNRSPNT